MTIPLWFTWFSPQNPHANLHRFPFNWMGMPRINLNVEFSIADFLKSVPWKTKNTPVHSWCRNTRHARISPIENRANLWQNPPQILANPYGKRVFHTAIPHRKPQYESTPRIGSNRMQVESALKFHFHSFVWEFSRIDASEFSTWDLKSRINKVVWSIFLRGIHAKNWYDKTAANFRACAWKKPCLSAQKRMQSGLKFQNIECRVNSPLHCWTIPGYWQVDPRCREKK